MLMRTILVALGLLAGLTGARAQNFVTYLDFEGRVFIQDNPTSATCQASNIVYGSSYTVVYRFTLNPSVVADALAFVSEHSDARVVSTQSPSFSLSNAIVGGPSTTNWDYINSRAGAPTGPFPSSSNLTFGRGGGSGPIVPTSGAAIVVGTINDFLAISGCTVTLHGAMVVRPN
jgi:hypothetical protein